MTQGITNSLNLTLMRLNAIEGNFTALEGISDRINSIDNAPDTDFKAILDDKIEEANKNPNKIEDLVESSPLDIQNETQTQTKTQEDKKVQKIEELKNAINLKSKIDLKSQSTNVEEIIETYANKYNIDGDFIKAIIKQESNFNSDATSKKGAMGLMQLMPKTAESLGVVDAYNPNQNIEGGVKYLRGLLDRFDNNNELALAAYNAGPTAVKKYGGVPPYKETQNYVNSIMSAYEQLKSLNSEKRYL